MTPSVVPAALRAMVRRRAGYRCEYCHTPEWLSGLECEIDHILPISQGGQTTEDNLCLACSACNGFKQASTQGVDPVIGDKVSLFHPRQHRWEDHFAWSEDSTRISGLTSIGRATISILRMNNDLIVNARRIWVFAGLRRFL